MDLLFTRQSSPRIMRQHDVNKVNIKPLRALTGCEGEAIVAVHWTIPVCYSEADVIFPDSLLLSMVLAWKNVGSVDSQARFATRGMRVVARMKRV
jgi:hypothetical protein